ncbi:MAG: DEAD/DEAH box helicase, partial [Rhodospirillales bacterium]
FVRDVEKIIAAVPKQRPTLFFSASMPQDVVRLAGKILNGPLRVEVTPESTTVERIEQSVYFVKADEKRALLADVLKNPALSRVLVFAKTKHRANRVAEHLDKAGVSAEAIHGNKSQGARQRALERFRSGQARVLVATDIAARGIDVEHVSHVINYELPNVPESYVHRIGRTARAGASGIAFSFCDPSERAFLRDIEKLTKCRLTVIGETPADNGARPAPRNHQAPRPHKKRRRNRPSRVRQAA